MRSGKLLNIFWIGVESVEDNMEFPDSYFAGKERGCTLKYFDKLADKYKDMNFIERNDRSVR